MRTIHLNDDDCFLVIKPNMQAQINVPTQLPEDEVPDYAKYTVALTHLIAEGNKMLDWLVKEKWNELVEHYKLIREGEGLND